MPFADSDFIKLNLPPGITFNTNGVTMTVDTAVANALDEGGSREAALAILYTMAESDGLISETIGRYSYTKWAMRGSDYWKIQAGAAAMDSTAPNVMYRPSSLLGGRCVL